MKFLTSKYRSQTSDSCCQHHREDKWQWLIWWIEILWRICVTDLNNKEGKLLSRCNKVGSLWQVWLLVPLLMWWAAVEHIYVHHSSSSSSISLSSLVLLSDNLHPEALVSTASINYFPSGVMPGVWLLSGGPSSCDSQLRRWGGMERYSIPSIGLVAHLPVNLHRNYCSCWRDVKNSLKTVMSGTRGFLALTGIWES